MNGVVAARSDDGALHLQHGPIDLIITVDAADDVREQLFVRAHAALGPVLADLVDELDQLRTPATSSPSVNGAVARRMVAATAGHGELFITPMAAVAGAVADHVLAAMVDGSGELFQRIIVNNGGDIAFHLAPGALARVGLVSDLAHPELSGVATVTFDDGVRGVATSGWQGRSMSLGIADAVTVLAIDAASADAAASLIASAVDLPADERAHPGIRRLPASTLDETSDLGDRLVTVGVDGLTPHQASTAAAAGGAVARRLIDAGRIVAALIVVGDHRQMVAAAPTTRSLTS